MLQKEIFLEEFKLEAINTKKIIECIPQSQSSWKPTEKSMSIIHLASHLVELTWWMEVILKRDFIDYAEEKNRPDKLRDKTEISNKLDEVVENGIRELEIFDEINFSKEWSFKIAGKTYIKLTKSNAIRKNVFNHLIHHRGQLTMFLRLLDIKIPGIYGPTADESPAND